MLLFVVFKREHGRFEGKTLRNRGCVVIYPISVSTGYPTMRQISYPALLWQNVPNSRLPIYSVVEHHFTTKRACAAFFSTSQGKLDPVARKMCFCTHKLLSLANFFMQLKKVQITFSSVLAKLPHSPTLCKNVLNFRIQHIYSASFYTSFLECRWPSIAFLAHLCGIAQALGNHAVCCFLKFFLV